MDGSLRRSHLQWRARSGGMNASVLLSLCVSVFLVVHADAALSDLRNAVECGVANAAAFSKKGPSVKIEAEDFADYGCFCGQEGVSVAKTGTPVDAIDTCCYEHHKCWYEQHAPHIASRSCPVRLAKRC